MKMHHIGIACLNIEKTLKDISAIHKVNRISKIVYDAHQNAKLCMVELEGGEKLELISGPKVEKLVKKGISYYHLCYSVGDIHKSINELTLKGAILVSNPTPAILFEGKMVAFLLTSYGLIELLSEK
jgi:methylmalonyl-CoA/ethylmalonyl-CoA epimerase